MPTKTCTRCRESKDFSEFYSIKGRPSAMCKPCCADYAKEWRNKNPDKYKKSYKKSQAKYYSKNKATLIAKTSSWRKSNQAKHRDYRRAYRDSLRAEYFKQYGEKCQCCGEGRIEFLTIEHCNGGGSKHRREVGAGNGVILDLKKQGWPSGYATKCWNCNCATKDGKRCPHEIERENADSGN